MANKPTTGRFIASLSLLGCTLSNVQAESCRPWQSSDAQNTALRIGTITVQSQDIFDLNDPKESHWYNRTANRLHIQTDKNVIIHQLLFKPGDPYVAAKLAESERLLRAQRYLKEARIVAEKVCGKHIQVTVHTRDNWTLTTGVSFGQAGGNSNSGIEIDEHNLLGMGKSLTLGYKQDNDRNQIHLGYHDPNLFGTHYQLTAAAQDNSDGNGYQFNLTLPFYQFDSKRAWGISAQHLEQETPIYGQGQVLHKIGEDNLAANFFYGWSEGRRQDRTERYLIGWQYARKGYFTTPSNTDYPPPEVQSYPWLGYEYVQDKYTQRENFHTMGNTEDIALGHQGAVSAGLLHPQLGADATYLKLNASYSKGFSLSPQQLGLVSLENTTWLGNGLHRGGRTTLKGEWNYFNTPNSSWHVSGIAKAADNLVLGEQILLGGTEGLRGYPTGYQTGDKSIVLKMEKRFYFNGYPFHVAKVGAVAFADAGTAWGQGKPAEWLGDIGVGLRVVSTRSSSGKVLHIDLALPVNTQGKPDDYQLVIGTQTGF